MAVIDEPEENEVGDDDDRPHLSELYTHAVELPGGGVVDMVLPPEAGEPNEPAEASEEE